MSVYIYCIREDHHYQSSIKGREFENDWFRLAKDGMVVIKGTHAKGYAWDGCSPKIKIKDLYIGTPEAVLNWKTGVSKTYYASLVHDVFYQFSKDIKSFVRRKEADLELYAILKRDHFCFARAYYLVVRWLGWIYWGKKC